ncbi:MAG: hypothetical protein Q7K45_03125, partial [Nanoarchaeota archaeon]|nr:hypothetical protein [Nanoarchaeota archaeon]
DDGFCFIDADADEEPDSEQPAQGYFYKITWGVTAPRDEAFTPLVDENGVAVSFNIWLDKMPDGEPQTDAANAIFMYSKQGDRTSPIRLNNGESDHDDIIHYSPNLYEEACIVWDKHPYSTDSFSGRSAVKNVCFSVDISSVGEVNWQRSGQSAPSITVQSGEVQRNSQW